MKQEFEIHALDTRIFISDAAIHQMHDNLTTEKHDRRGFDLEMSAQALACAAETLHSIDGVEIETAMKMVSVAADSGATGLAMMVSTADMPFGKFQVVFLPQDRVIVVCGGSEAQDRIHKTVMGTRHTLHCPEKVHNNACMEKMGDASKKPMTADISPLLDTLSKIAGQHPETPETKNRIKKFDSPSNN